MAASNGDRSDGQLTRALVERAATGAPGGQLRSQVAAWRPEASAEQVEEAVQQACLLAADSCGAQSEDEVFVWLRTTARRELAHIHDRAGREVPVDAAALGRLPGAGVAPAPEQELIAQDAHADVNRAAHAVLDRLSLRQREIVALHARGRKRPQIATHLGLTPRTVKRQLEKIMTVGRAELVHLAGHGCAAGEPIVARLAFGLANPPEAGQAQIHLAGCPQCALLYERLDVWRERVAALVPVPAVEPAHPGLVDWALQRASEAAATVKHHASSAYARAVDPTPVAGARPGAAVAAIAGCLAIGGGTTYCVTQNVDPITGLAQVVGPAREQEPTREDPRRRRHPQATAATTATATPTATPTTTPTPTPTPTATPVATPTSAPPTATVQATPEPTPEPTPPPVPEEEYEPVAPAAPATSAPPAAAPARTPAPANGPGEFEP